jgi:hypothetical protein
MNTLNSLLWNILAEKSTLVLNFGLNLFLNLLNQVFGEHRFLGDKIGLESALFINASCVNVLMPQQPVFCVIVEGLVFGNIGGFFHFLHPQLHN